VTEEAGGRFIKRLLAQTVLVPPRDKIVAWGTADTVETSRGSLRFSRVMNMLATAYTPWDEGCIGIAKLGIPAKRGIVAVDPEVIPLGTRLFIPGYGHALAADIGGAIQGNRIDLCVESREEAFQFGRRQVKVYILA
jgi:3D (Asp-Asp-Asp) domain-containing protein